jgi:raffinose/stachyose/melibiose transport system substrate-binding protein
MTEFRRSGTRSLAAGFIALGTVAAGSIGVAMGASAPHISASARTSASICPKKAHYTLTVFASQGWVLPGEEGQPAGPGQPAIEGLNAKFKKLCGITVQDDLVPSDNYQSVLTNDLDSGQMPGDIYMGQPSQSALELTYQVKKHAVNLTNQPWVKHENKEILDQATLGGKVYGQSVWDFASGSWILVYNKKDFAKAGVKGVPRTFAAFLADCKKLKAKGFYPIYEPLSDGWHQTLWFAEAGPQMQKLDPGLIHKLNVNKAHFAKTKVALTAMEQINELYHKGYFGPTALTDTVANAYAKLASGKYAMYDWSVTVPTSIHQAYPKIPVSRFGFMPMPLVNNQYIPVNPQTPTKFIYKGGPHVKGAEEYLDFLAEPSSLHYAIENESTTVTEDYNDVNPKWEKWTPEARAFEKAYKLSPTSVFQVSVNYVGPQWGNIATDMDAMFTGQESPLQVLKNIDARRAQEAKAAHDPHWP